MLTAALWPAPRISSACGFRGRAVFVLRSAVCRARTRIFRDEGFDIELSTAFGADKGAAALISGSVDIGFFGPEAAVYIYLQGARDYLVAFAQLTAMDGSFLMAREPTDNFQWTDLKGKVVVGARPGGVPQMMLEWIIRQHGMDPYEDMTMITNLAFEAAPGAFHAGLGDYIAQFSQPVPDSKQGVRQW